MINQVFAIDPSGFQRHSIHAQERQWAETNCYVDVWIELLHAWGFDPVAALPFTVGIDFEGDQWTFFKFPLADLDRMYGLDVQELQIWRPLVEHLHEQVTSGRPVLVELDSFYLPDTAGTAYRTAHVKTTVAVIEIDTVQKWMGYFHGQGYYHLGGEDYEQILHLAGAPHTSILPPYCEIVKRRPAAPISGEFLTHVSLDRFKAELCKLPVDNPFRKFKPRFESDLKWLAGEPIETFHKYSFATLRQFGACYELTATYLRWLQSRGIRALEQPIEMFEGLSSAAKTMQFQLARAMARKRSLDLTPIDQMAGTWRTVTDDLRAKFLTGD